MKSRLLWDRWLSHWLPPEKVTKDVKRDIDEALRATYRLPDGKGAAFALKGGPSMIVVTEARTTVASRIPPRAPLQDRPDWLDWRGPLAGKERAALLKEAIRGLIARPRPHAIVRTGRRPLTLDEIALGEGTVVVVNEPDGTETVDSVRIARARRALEALGSVGRAREARKLLDGRMEAAGGSDAIDRKLREMIRRSKVGSATFFDATDLLDGVSPRELALAGEKP